MQNIAILSASVRKGRNSHRAALYLKSFIERNKLANVSIVDLKEFDFPIFEERLRFLENPASEITAFAQEIKAADGVIIVTPEYNGGYPASLKNVVDLLYDEWQRKPIAICTCSAGGFGGAQVLVELQFTLWKIGALTVPAMFPIPQVQNTFDENGNATDQEFTDKRAKKFVDELLWVCEKLRAKS